MSYNETIDNYLYDEENEYTQANDLWEDFFMEKQDEIDERPWIQADALVHRKDLNRQVGDMLDRVLPEEEREKAIEEQTKKEAEEAALNEETPAETAVEAESEE